MIYIVIDNAPLEADILGVFRSWELANEFVNGLPENTDDSLTLVVWDTINNKEVTYTEDAS